MSEFETAARRWLATCGLRRPPIGLHDILSHLSSHIQAGTQDRAGLSAVLRLATDGELDALKQRHPGAYAMAKTMIQEAQVHG